MKLLIDNTQIPMEPHPLFLGLKSRPETLLQRTSNSYISKNSQPRQSDPQNKRVKAKKSSRHQPHNLQVTYPIHHRLCLISSTQRILNKVQTIQNNTLKTIKRFSLRSSTTEIHEVLKLERIETWAKKTARKYANSRLNHPLLTKEYEAYMKQKSTTTNLKWTTIFDLL